MNLKIIVAAHKKYWMPEDKMYVPLHVGKEGKQDLGYIGDNTGENISLKNPNYCELTGLYWAWKNLNSDYIGLAHYRRHFTCKSIFKKTIADKKHIVMTNRDADKIFEKYDAIVPNKRKYYIETNESHYNHAHQAKDLEMTRQIVKNMYPEYSDAFEAVMRRTSAHMFNMFVLKKELFNGYCKWLFDILSELEKRTDLTNYSESEARIFGYISELLLDVWLDYNQIKYKEVKVIFMERQNWIVKVYKFLKRKFI